MSSTRRILVFGSSNVGKTSILNSLTGERRKTSSDAKGTTFGTDKYPPCARPNGMVYHFYDTAGLNETDAGTVTQAQAAENLRSLITHSAHGFSMIVLVVRCGTILEADLRNYKMFVENFTNHAIPVMCVITGCENEAVIEDYANKNKVHFDRNGMKFHNIVSGCFAVGQTSALEKFYCDPRNESTDRLWKVIEKATLSQEPIVFISKIPGAWKLPFKRLWNDFCDWTGWISMRVDINMDQEIYDMLDRMGIKDAKKKRDMAEIFAAQITTDETSDSSLSIRHDFEALD